MSANTISYNSWKHWVACPYKHKLIKIDRLDHFLGNQFSCFGTAMHNTAEQLLRRQQDEKDLGGVKDDSFDPKDYFFSSFDEEINKIKEPARSKIDTKMVKEMKEQGVLLLPLILPALKEYFGEYTLVSCEQEIRHPVDGFPTFDFHGYIDLILQTTDGKYHIIDWKSCSWGWDLKKRTSTEITYQLSFYKHYFCESTGVSPDDVETHFGLLKRTATKDKIELFRISNGKKKIANALNILNSCVVNISRGVFIKNRLSCNNCEFRRTIHCP